MPIACSQSLQWPKSISLQSTRRKAVEPGKIGSAKLAGAHDGRRDGPI